MPDLWLPAETDIARAARGWPSNPHEKPAIPVEVNTDHPAAQYLAALFWMGSNGAVNLWEPDNNLPLPSNVEGRGNSWRKPLANLEATATATRGFLDTDDVSTYGGFTCLLTLDMHKYGNWYRDIFRFANPSSGLYALLTGTNKSTLVMQAGLHFSSQITLTCDADGLDAKAILWRIGYQTGPSSENQLEGWINGRYQSNGPINNSAAMVTPRTMDRLRVGNIYGNYNEFDIKLAAVFKGALPDAVCQSLSEKPNLLVRPKDQSPFLIGVPSGAGGPETIEAALSVGLSQGVSSSNIATLLASSSLELTSGLSSQVNAILEAATSLSMSASASAGSLATLYATVSYGLEPGYAVDGDVPIGPQVIEAALPIGLVQGIDAITVANLYAATSLGHELALTITAGNQIEAALSFALQNSFVTTSEISIEGSVPLGLTQALSVSTRADLQATATLAHQAGLQAIASAVLEAGLPLSCIQSITTSGFALVVGIVTPDSRTITITVQDSTATSGDEDRTFTIPE